MQSTLNWFEIFVSDMDRAQAFYERILAIKLKSESFMGEPHAIFPSEGLAGALVKRANRQPSADGVLIYLNCEHRLDAVIDMTPQAGGRVIMPKTDMGEPGFIAIIGDTEGNVVGVHSSRSIAA